jgi:hypothetical protein
MTLYSWSTPGETLQIAHGFEDWQGLVSGLVLCCHTGRAAILQLLAWKGANLEQRIYSIGLLPTRATDIFIRNVQSAYYDVTRFSREVDALMSLRDFQCDGLFQMPEGVCLATHPIEPPIHHPDWRQLTADDPKFTAWWDKFG